MNIIQRFAKKIPGSSKRGDIPAFISFPILFIVLVFVLVVLIYAWTMPGGVGAVLSQTSNSVGLPVTGTALHYPNGTAVQGFNQTTYTNVFNILYSFDTYLPLILYIALLSIAISTLVLSPNPIAWYLGVLFAPFIYWISTYEGNFAYQIFNTPVIYTASGAISILSAIPNGQIASLVQVMAQLNTITFIFYILYIIALSIRIYFYNPSASQTASQDMANAMQRRGIQ